MSILVVAGVLFGMILGQFFKWFVLFPAFGFATILVLTSPGHVDNGLLGLFPQFIALTTSLQIGYVLGLVVHNFRSAPKSSNELGVHSLAD
jgi:hypothetical protein